LLGALSRAEEPIVPVLLYWGDDEFALHAAVQKLTEATVDAAWASFNYEKILADKAEAVTAGLNQAMTPPFGAGQRLVWLAEAQIFSQSNDALLADLARSLPQIPETGILLFTTGSKPDGRSKITKLLHQHAVVKEFAAISAWKGAEIEEQVRRKAAEMQVALLPEALELLAIAVGNNSRQLHTELSKLQIFAGGRQQPLTADEVGNLVAVTTQNSLQLAEALRQGDVARSLELIGALLERNEPALRIIATLVGQFRTWLGVTAAIEEGATDEAIAKETDLGNPKRLYFLRKDLKGLKARQISLAFSELLTLEFAIKQGQDSTMALQTMAIKVCQILKR
jgi:DNA polymerase III subunit delta